MLGVPVGALYRAGHVVVNCGLFYRRAMERLAKLRLREIRAQQQQQEQQQENPMETSRNFSRQQAATGPVAKNVRVIRVGYRLPSFSFSFLLS